MPRSVLVALVLWSALAGPGVARAGLLSLTVIGGLTGLDGSTSLGDPLAQESLSGSTLAQLGTPLLYDPDGFLGITVRIQNISDQEIAFPDALPGVSVLSGVSGVSGYSSRLNVGAGGAARSGGAGSEGTLSRTVLDLTDSLTVLTSPASGPNGGGGGAGTGVADNWIALTGASGQELAAYLAGMTLAPGAWIDVPDFARITAFQRASETARMALGFDLPTFTFGGVTVTCGAWTGSFSEAGIVEPPPPPPPDPVALPEPPSGAVLPVGLALLALGRRRLVPGQKRGE